MFSFSGPGGRALECNLTGGAHFLRISTDLFRKKIAFRYPVSELLDYKSSPNNKENSSSLFLKTIDFCS